ncbi:hypothetical protein BCh11DRAFT_07581 [Burkholderia sp. Ch1-1]|nr:hypothetical protein BCh11DRAFT_07581 [Burkholderia sp. Ch1-1]
MCKFIQIVRLLFVVVLTGGSVGVGAQDAFPSKTIRIVVPFTPGGVNDVVARVLAAGLSEQLHQPVIVENRPGAGGDVGTMYVMRQPADGYVLLMTSNAVDISTAVKKKPAFDSTKDLQPISFVGTQWMTLVSAPSFPPKNIQQLVAVAKSKPGNITCATPGPGTPHQLAMQFFKHYAGIDLLMVPFQGSAPALTDVMAGRVSIYFAAVSSADPYVRSGKLKVLGVTGHRRLSAYPGVQTFAEAGVPGMDFGFWYGLTAPKGTPSPVVKQLHDAVVTVMQTPRVQAVMREQSLDAEDKSPEEFGKLISDDVVNLRAVKKAANIQVD